MYDIFKEYFASPCQAIFVEVKLRSKSLILCKICIANMQESKTKHFIQALGNGRCPKNLRVFITTVDLFPEI